MIVISTMKKLPDKCYDCPCLDGEYGQCRADEEGRIILEDRPSWCPLKEINNDVSGKERIIERLDQLQKLFELKGINTFAVNIRDAIDLLKEQEKEKKCCGDCEYYGNCHDD